MVSADTILAYNVNGKELFVCPPYGMDFSVVEITCDPPAKFYEWTDGSWRGKTSAMEGHFFGVVCENGQCTPLDVDFVAGLVVEEIPRTHEGVTAPTLWAFYIIMGSLVGMLLVLCGYLVKCAMGDWL